LPSESFDDEEPLPRRTPAELTVRPVAEPRVLARERNSGLRAALAELPERMRAVVALRLGGLRYEEIAETLGVGLNTVRSQLHEGKKRLRHILGASFPEIDDGEGR
jgi:RNA polymerase sigma factor (sigma-70 family)